MTVSTLFTADGGWLGTDRLVFGADEIDSLGDCVAQAAHLAWMIESREAELAGALEAARAEGRREGVEAGRREAAATLAAELRRIEAEAREALPRRREETASLALAVVRRIADGLAPEERLAALARRAAEDLLEEPRRRLRVHPSRRDAVRARLGAGPAHAIDEVVEDEGLDPDGALVDTGRGSVAIDLDVQLEEVARLLAGSEDRSDLDDPDGASGASGAGDAGDAGGTGGGAS